MTTIHFVIDPDRLTIDDLIAAEEPESLSAREKRDLLARHLVDDEGAFMEARKAQKIIGALTMAQQLDAVNAFNAAIQERAKQMLPLASATPS